MHKPPTFTTRMLKYTTNGTLPAHTTMANTNCMDNKSHNMHCRLSHTTNEVPT